MVQTPARGVKFCLSFEFNRVGGIQKVRARNCLRMGQRNFRRNLKSGVAQTLISVLFTSPLSSRTLF